MPSNEFNKFRQATPKSAARLLKALSTMKISENVQKNLASVFSIVGVASAAFTAYFAPFFGLVFDSVSTSDFVEQSKYLFVFLISTHIYLVALSILGFLIAGLNRRITGALFFASIPIANLCFIFILGQVIGGW
ncbi:hypothetical protein [Microbulbifer agarilyticus]